PRAAHQLRHAGSAAHPGRRGRLAGGGVPQDDGDGAGGGDRHPAGGGRRHPPGEGECGLMARALALLWWLCSRLPRALGLLLLGREALLFWALRRRLFRNSLGSLLGGSAVRPFTILLVSVL